MEGIRTFKAAVSAAVAALTALWGWFGWLVIGWIACMAIDYVTGSAAALREGTWNSQTARDGIWHKVGCSVAVVAAGMMDLVIGLLVDHMPGVELPFEYRVLFCALVVVWYILTEIGSIIENAGLLGAPVPRWLQSAIEKLRDRVDESACAGAPDEDNAGTKAR